jgi:hypothetical protein
LYPWSYPFDPPTKQTSPHQAHTKHIHPQWFTHIPNQWVNKNMHTSMFLHLYACALQRSLALQDEDADSGDCRVWELSPGAVWALPGLVMGPAQAAGCSNSSSGEHGSGGPSNLPPPPLHLTPLSDRETIIRAVRMSGLWKHHVVTAPELIGTPLALVIEQPTAPACHNLNELESQLIFVT